MGTRLGEGRKTNCGKAACLLQCTIKYECCICFAEFTVLLSSGMSLVQTMKVHNTCLGVLVRYRAVCSHYRIAQLTHVVMYTYLNEHCC